MEVGMHSTTDTIFDFKAVDSRLPKALQVYELLRNAITMLKLAPGDSLSERDLCAQLGVSRTPLREALILLETQKLVEIRSSTGTFITQIFFQDVLASARPGKPQNSTFVYTKRKRQQRRKT
jgi:GntR family transcriptional regulator, rspAB operon transcriptional repressor